MAATTTRPEQAVALRLAAAFAVFGVFWGAWGALLPDIKRALDATDAELGRALLFVPIGSLPGMLLAGRVVDRLGPRIFGPSIALFGLTTFLPGTVSEMAVFVFVLVVVGVATGAMDVVINACVSGYEIRFDRRLMGRAHAWFSAGVLVAGVSVGLARSAGLGPLEVLGATGVATLAVAWFGREMDLPAKPPSETGEVHTTKLLLLLGGLCGLAFLIEDGMLSWSAIHLEDTLGATPFVGSLGPGALAASMVTGRALTQWLSERASDRTLVTGAGAIGSVGAMLAAFAPTTLVALIGVAVTGAAISACAPLIFGVAGRSAGPGRQGQSIARVTTLAYLGFVVGPPLVGGIAGLTDLRLGIAAMAGVSLLLGLGARLLPARDGRPSP